MICESCKNLIIRKFDWGREDSFYPDGICIIYTCKVLSKFEFYSNDMPDLLECSEYEEKNENN